VNQSGHGSVTLDVTDTTSSSVQQVGGGTTKITRSDGNTFVQIAGLYTTILSDGIPRIEVPEVISENQGADTKKAAACAPPPAPRLPFCNIIMGDPNRPDTLVIEGNLDSWDIHAITQKDGSLVLVVGERDISVTPGIDPTPDVCADNVVYDYDKLQVEGVNYDLKALAEKAMATQHSLFGEMSYMEGDMVDLGGYISNTRELGLPDFVPGPAEIAAEKKEKEDAKALRFFQKC